MTVGALSAGMRVRQDFFSLEIFTFSAQHRDRLIKFNSTAFVLSKDLRPLHGVDWSCKPAEHVDAGNCCTGRFNQPWSACIVALGESAAADGTSGRRIQERVGRGKSGDSQLMHNLARGVYGGRSVNESATANETVVGSQ